MMLWRPMLCEPPLFTMKDLREWVTLPDLLDAHEALDLKSAMAERAAERN
jgi:hypothetical protein